MKSYVIHFIRHGAIDETLSGKYIGTTVKEQTIVSIKFLLKSEL